MATWGNVEASLAPAKDGPRSKRKLKPSMTISGLAAEVFSVRFSPDGKFLYYAASAYSFGRALARRVVALRPVAIPITTC